MWSYIITAWKYYSQSQVRKKPAAEFRSQRKCSRFSGRQANLNGKFETQSQIDAIKWKCARLFVVEVWKIKFRGSCGDCCGIGSRCEISELSIDRRLTAEHNRTNRKSLLSFIERSKNGAFRSFLEAFKSSLTRSLLVRFNYFRVFEVSIASELNIIILELSSFIRNINYVINRWYILISITDLIQKLTVFNVGSPDRGITEFIILEESLEKTERGGLCF